MNAEIPEVNVKFKVSPIFALVAIVALWPFGLAFGAIGTIFGIGLLGLCAALGLPKSTDLMFGLILALMVFAGQFLGGVFLGIELGGSQVSMVFTTVVLWFLQLAAFGVDLHFFAKSHVVEVEADTTKPRGRRSAFSAEVGRSAA